MRSTQWPEFCVTCGCSQFHKTTWLHFPCQHLDAQNQDGLVDVEAELSSQDFDSAKLAFKLMDDSGASIPLKGSDVTFKPQTGPITQQIVVTGPKPWDAEHPNLYELEVSLRHTENEGKGAAQNWARFRVRRVKFNFQVNGQPVKLRGVCRHTHRYCRCLGSSIEMTPLRV